MYPVLEGLLPRGMKPYPGGSILSSGSPQEERYTCNRRSWSWTLERHSDFCKAYLSLQVCTRYAIRPQICRTGRVCALFEKEKVSFDAGTSNIDESLMRGLAPNFRGEVLLLAKTENRNISVPALGVGPQAARREGSDNFFPLSKRQLHAGATGTAIRHPHKHNAPPSAHAYICAQCTPCHAISILISFALSEIPNRIRPIRAHGIQKVASGISSSAPSCLGKKVRTRHAGAMTHPRSSIISARSRLQLPRATKGSDG